MSGAKEATAEMFVLPDGSQMFDGGPVNATSAGVIVSSDGEFYSLAQHDGVFGATEPARNGDISMRRVDKGHKMSMPDASEPQPPSYGTEFEFNVVDGEGNLSPNIDMNNELFTCQAEFPTDAVDSPRELQETIVDHVVQMAELAVEKDVLLLPTGVLGQDAKHLVNTIEYVRHMELLMAERTGFPIGEHFRVSGLQTHTNISNFEASLQAAEAMQMLNPILAAPSQSGPFLDGGAAGELSWKTLTEKQREHLEQRGITPADLDGQYMSYRYLLRSIASPSGGIWQQPAPTTREGYISEVNEQLKSGETFTSDRVMGWHTDRIRTTLTGNGVATFESHSHDTLGGVPQQITDHQIRFAEVFTALEARAMRGEDVVASVASMLGVQGNREEALQAAHRMSLEVSRHGNDAQVYGRQLQTLLKNVIEPIAAQSPHVQLDEDAVLRIRKSYATDAETRTEVQRWTVENPDRPLTDAYYELQMNSLAWYMREEANRLQGTESGGKPSTDIVRAVELSTAESFHTFVERDVAA